MIYIQYILNIVMKVNSYDEWSPLKEIIVGAGFPESLPTADFSFKVFFHDNLYGTNFYKNSSTYITKQDIEEHNEDVEGYVDILTSLGVKVHRPKVPNNVRKVKTNTFESTNFPALNPRDLAMVIGNEIIETPPICRYRYFENDYLKHIFMEYFSSGSQWTVAPRPLLLDSSFDLDYISDRDQPGAREYYESQQKDDKHPLNMGYEIMFDAACCMRLGKHIIMNVCNKNSELGCKWLQAHLGDEYIVEQVRVCDWHIDSTFVPLRPGLALVSHDHIIQRLPKWLQKWDYVVAPDELALEVRDQTMLASPYIDINVLSIDESTIIANTADCTTVALEKLLKPYNIDVIGSRLRHDEKFSGAHHCLTIDTVRDSTKEDYSV